MAQTLVDRLRSAFSTEGCQPQWHGKAKGTNHKFVDANPDPGRPIRLAFAADRGSVAMLARLVVLFLCRTRVQCCQQTAGESETDAGDKRREGELRETGTKRLILYFSRASARYLCATSVEGHVPSCQHVGVELYLYTVPRYIHPVSSMSLSIQHSALTVNLYASCVWFICEREFETGLIGTRSPLVYTVRGTATLPAPSPPGRQRHFTFLFWRASCPLVSHQPQLLHSPRRPELSSFVSPP